MKENLWIESECFIGYTIHGETVIPDGSRLRHVKDVNTGKVYTIVKTGDGYCHHYYSYEEETA